MKHSQADNSRAKECINFENLVDLEEGLNKLLIGGKIADSQNNLFKSIR